jgi:nicotinate-nucleotide adenylyltransferase
MEFFRRAPGRPRKLGILAGTFNPPTRAHLALARAALAVMDEVVFVLPRALPHKPWTGAPFEDRVRMLEAAIEGEPRCSIAATAGGLFAEIAPECREAYGDRIELFFLCGRDAADRIINWDYGRPGAILEQLREYRLLVAPRKGRYEPPSELRDFVLPLPFEPEYGGISATDVREKIRRGEPWEHLVPEKVAPLARMLYGKGQFPS